MADVLARSSLASPLWNLFMTEMQTSQSPARRAVAPLTARRRRRTAEAEAEAAVGNRAKVEVIVEKWWVNLDGGRGIGFHAFVVELEGIFIGFQLLCPSSNI